MNAPAESPNIALFPLAMDKFRPASEEDEDISTEQVYVLQCDSIVDKLAVAPLLHPEGCTCIGCRGQEGSPQVITCP